MPRIARYPPFGKRFFRLARKLIGSCHFQPFWRVVLALAEMQGRRSLNRMQGLFKDRRTRQAIADFLKKAAWDAPEVLRQQALDLLEQLGFQAGDTVYLLLDDTQKRKRGKRMDALKKVFLHAEKVYATGHTMLGAALVFRGVVIPFRIPLWAPKPFCQASQREPNPADRIRFRKLTELAADAIDAVALPEGVKGIVLFDADYLCPTVTQACQRNGFRYVGVARKNRNFFPDGRPRDKRRLSPYGANVLRREGRSGKVRGKKHRLAQRVGRLSKLGRVKLVFSRRPHESCWIALTTDETRWSAKTVLSHYLARWGIELFFKELKSTLGFHQYQFQKFAAVEGWTELALTALLYLEWYRVRQLARRGLSEEDKRWWRHQRTHGLCQAIRLASQQSELSYLAKRLQTPGGIAKLKRLLRNAFAPEYRAAL